MDGQVIAVLLMLAVLSGGIALWLTFAPAGGERTPRIQSREAPVIHRAPAPDIAVTVGGRVYLVPPASAVERATEPCPWCLRMPEPGDDVVRCSNRHCARIVHRAHMQENGACGGICAVL